MKHLWQLPCDEQWNSFKKSWDIFVHAMVSLLWSNPVQLFARCDSELRTKLTCTDDNILERSTAEFLELLHRLTVIPIATMCNVPSFWRCSNVMVNLSVLLRPSSFGPTLLAKCFGVTKFQTKLSPTLYSLNILQFDCYKKSISVLPGATQGRWHEKYIKHQYF